MLPVIIYIQLEGYVAFVVFDKIDKNIMRFNIMYTG